jgi:hypothetical protein
MVLIILKRESKFKLTEKKNLSIFYDLDIIFVLDYYIQKMENHVNN